MKNKYTTSQVAKIIGVHPNTIRLYERVELIPKVERLPNGYRVFTDFHIQQLKLCRIALKIEVLQNGLRKKILNIIKLSAKSDFHKAIVETRYYINQVKIEEKNAEEAIKIVERLFSGTRISEKEIFMTRKQTAEYLDVTIDTLRNWEMNGLIFIKRKQNGYRVYTNEDIKILKIIRLLRCENYSLSSILRMLNSISENSNINIRSIIDTPREYEDIIKVGDRLLTSLSKAKVDGNIILDKLMSMQKRFNI